MKMLAKPSGVLLEDHISHVIDEANALLQAYPATIKKYAQLSGGKDFTKWLVAAAKYHDDGKKNKSWQKACELDHYAFLKWLKENPGKKFRDYEKDQPSDAGKNLRELGLRHEFASLLMHKDHGFAIPVRVAIAAHHGKLSTKHEKRWKTDFGNDSEQLWKEFKHESVKDLDISVAPFHEFENFLKRYPLIAGIRSWLVAADQRASVNEADEFLPILKPFIYSFPFKEKRSVQDIVEKYWEEQLLLIRAPTGAGKTDAALLWAQKQIKVSKASRLIIAMPTRFTSNALSIEVAKNLSETGLYHSSAWLTRFQKRLEQHNISFQEAHNEHEFARRLFTPVTVCTIDHLLMALTITREDHHQILFNLMNSCLVIDEADFYDEFTQANILVLLQALKIWDVPVMIMSASLPEASKSFYSRSGYNISSIKEDTSDYTRPRCKIDSIIKAESIEGIEKKFHECIEIGAGIIYANTVSRAMLYYTWFWERGIKTILYHSRFTEPDKKAKEEELLATLGRNGSGKGIAILTQIGEMSVNISADWMLSDVCPIDRLVQRAGRLSRFNKNIGSFNLVIPLKGEILYPAPYGEYKRPNWLPHRALIETIDKLNPGAIYTAKEFVRLINEVYPSETLFGKGAEKNAENLKEYFVNNWMISSCELSREDDERTNFWKSRDIESNESVFIETPKAYYSNWNSYNSFKNEYSVNIHPYLIKIGLEKTFSLTRKTILVDDNKVSIVCIQNPNAYSYEKGLHTEAEFDQFL